MFEELARNTQTNKNGTEILFCNNNYNSLKYDYKVIKGHNNYS